MFFSDNNPNPRIEKAFLDGKNKVSIVYKGLTSVVSLTVDTALKRLYWADFGRNTLEGSDFDGSNRRVIRRLNGVLVSGLTYHQVPFSYIKSRRQWEHKFKVCHLVIEKGLKKFKGEWIAGSLFSELLSYHLVGWIVDVYLVTVIPTNETVSN